MAFTFQFLLMSSFLVLLSLTLLFSSCNARTDGPTMRMFEEWMSEHGRVYANAEEKQRRYEIFKDNVKYIEEFNKVGRRSYTLGITQFTDLTNEEFVDTYVIGDVTEEIPTTTETSMSDFEYENLPLRAAVDWRTKGSCWAFAAVATVESIYKIKKGVLKSLSEQQVLDCSGGGTCAGGSRNKAFNFIVANKGLTTEANYPYKGSKGVCDKNKLSDHAAYITGYRSVPKNSEAELMKAVNNQPVSVGVNAKPWHHYTGGIFNEACGPNVTHGVAVVGYGEESGKKYWIIKNSWGTKWGESGYMRIAKNVAAKQGLCGLATNPLYPYIISSVGTETSDMDSVMSVSSINCEFQQPLCFEGLDKLASTVL
ncbi:Ananain [Ananas comosus]|uniref:Ananain n=1 Tax=Ananas comosus TaxID=4615 RepID=A0A199V8G1_ANACO|nr:Ananain [Ananas comosus]